MKLLKKITIKFVCSKCGHEIEEEKLCINPNLKIFSYLSFGLLICGAGWLVDLFPPSTLQRTITVFAVVLFGAIITYFSFFIPSWDDWRNNNVL